VKTFNMDEYVGEFVYHGALSWETNSLSGSKEVPHILWDTYIARAYYWSLNMSQMNSI
jgi:hypothetical protein